MNIAFDLFHQMISRSRGDTGLVAAGSRNYLTAEFHLLTEDWTAPITAIFNGYAVVLDEHNQCLVPWEALANPGQVAVSAFCGDLHTATSTSFPVYPTGYVQGETPQAPSPSVYLQLTGMVHTATETADAANTAAENAQSIAQQILQAAESGAFDGAPGPQGPKGQDGTVSFSDLSEEQQESLRGKSAFAYAQEGGFSGTEAEFAARLAAEYLPAWHNAGSHNGGYRGKCLGTGVTQAQWAAVQDGTFRDLYIGDYWTIGGVNYRIAAFDYYMGTGDVASETHHVVIVPDTCLYAYEMNDTDTTQNGYGGTKLYAGGLSSAISAIQSAFGSSHVWSHRLCLGDGADGTAAWCDSLAELLTERMVYGSAIMGAYSGGGSIPAQCVEKTQLPLFAYNPAHIGIGETYWLRDVASGSDFAVVSQTGAAFRESAGSEQGIRPVFCLA